ncbi:hypothetical protein DENSPDRAFT_809563 [Dentipellis sp. KUC8613]|nr:hypothetical protein DENSPDRAFT_809563 [Dentipellis sp. KUC8613]
MKSLSPTMPWSRADTLPYAERPRSRTPTPTTLPRRHLRVLSFLFVCISFLGLFLFIYRQETPQAPHIAVPLPLATPSESPLPPMFGEWYERERQFPQHNPDLPYPQGREGRYLYMANHLWGLGWGNAMQEAILNAHLAYVANVSYVFHNYTWDCCSTDGYSEYSGKLIPAYIPMTAMVAGPLGGDPFSYKEHMPPAVMEEYFDDICETKTVISSEEINGQLGSASAMTILQAWVEKINSVSHNCIQVMKGSNQIFDFWLFGEATRLLDIWPSLSRSPILTEFAWSPLVVSAVETNAALIHPDIKPGLVSRTRLPGLLALHIRRGDFEEHCHLLAEYSSRWQGFNEMPEFIDRFEPPFHGGGGAKPTQEQYDEVARRCFPNVTQIVEKVRAVRASPAGRGLDRVYVLTNGKREWLDELKAALHADAKWTSVTTSRDMELNWEQKHIAQAVDMLIAERADVFVGNGFSSLTSNVVMLRMSKKFPSDTTRFW